MTVKEELELQAAAKRRVLEILSSRKSPVTPERLVASSANNGSRLPEYAVRRAIWALIVDGKAHLTLDNKIRPMRP
jgi:ribosomal protein S12 methylthiotransferase accessory factor YcaO